MIRLQPGEEHGLALDVIQIDGGTQSRATLNQQVVDDYAEAIKAGATFPPIVVFYDGKKHWLADGFHRFHAYQKAGRTNVPADVRQGTRRDAILHSVGANETHGLRRTRDDKRRAVLTLLNDKTWSKWSDREIASACRVDHKTVAKVRSDLGGEIPNERTYVTKHGTTATMKTAGINASRKNAREALVNDEPSPEAGLQAEAFHSQGTGAGMPADREGRHEGEAASVDLPTISDAQREADDIQSPFDRASDKGRALFLARNNLRQESNPATATGGIDVDRSTERASSAVKVGAPVLPQGATEIPAGSHGQCHELVAGPVDQQGKPLITADTVASASASNIPSDGDAFAAVKGKARLANAAGVEPSPSVANFTRSASLGAADGRHGTPSSEAAGAKMGDCSRPDRAGHVPGHHHSNSEQAVTNSPSAAPAETGEAPSPDPASPVTPSEIPAHGPCERIAREKPTNEPALVAPAGALGLTNQHGYETPTPPATNPNCAHPDTCKWARSMASCSACANAAMKARAA